MRTLRFNLWPTFAGRESFLRLATMLVAFLVLASILSPSAFAAAKISPALLTQLAAADADTPLEVVVSFHGNAGVTAAQFGLLNSVGITKGFGFKALPIAGVLATPAQIRALANVAGVRSIYPNAQLQYDNAEATAMTGADRLRNDMRLTVQNGGLPVSGRGATVLINDSGIDGLHSDLSYPSHVIQNVEAATNLRAWDSMAPITYFEGIPNTDLGGGHGTHVAGIVGASGARSGGKYEGVAPGASLVGYGSGATLLVLDAIGGFDYAVVSQPILGTRVINNSWGQTSDSNTPFDPDNPINIASKAANDRNIVVVFSAGNSGPIEGTISGNFKKAPWVVCVANSDKKGRIVDSSSRGVDGRKGTVVYDGVTYTWEDRPTVTAPGTDIISVRASTSSLQALSADLDATAIEPAYVPFYTHMSGTSMAAPHVAGVIALMLDANPALTTYQVKEILQQTATNMAGYEPWEAGAGMVNAYAAVDRAFNAARPYGSFVNMTRTFNSNAQVETIRNLFTIDYYTVPLLSPTQNRFTFEVPPNQTQLEAWVNVGGVEGQTGNTINLVLIGPDGTDRASSGVSVLFAIDYLRAAQVNNPEPGTWHVELRGLRGDPANPTQGAAIPEFEVPGTVKLKRAIGYTGLNDIAGHPAAAAIVMGVNERLVDGFSNSTFAPDQPLTRYQLADYLAMSTGVRQFFPTNGSSTFLDVTAAQRPLAEASTVKGSNLRDVFQGFRGVVLPRSSNTFGADDAVVRWHMAYALVQALGLENEAKALNGQAVTVAFGTNRIAIDDAAQIPAGYEGYVQLALDLNIMNAYFSLTQGPYDPAPTIHATFQPTKVVTRGDYAVDISRYYGAYFATP